jgi:hypothetical protein
MKIPQSSSSRWLAGIALTVLVLVIISVTLALVNRRGPALSPEDTPEGTVQRYLIALQEDDINGAYDYLNSNLKEYCDYAHFQDSKDTRGSGNERIVLKSSEIREEQAIVRIEVTNTNLSPPFDVNEYSYPVQYVLEQEGDVWRFSEPPWPLGWCPDWERKPYPIPPG